MKRAQRRAIDKRPAFLAAFVATASLTEAARAVGIDRSIHYDWLRNDAKYVAAFAQARIEAAQTLEDDAVQWARIGVYEPIVYQGEFQFAQRAIVLCTLPDGREVREEDLPEPIEDAKVISRRNSWESYGPPLGIYRRSEGLMGRLMKAFMPDRYGDRNAVELSGPGGGAIENSLTVTFVKPKE